jgi:hypothetical protein
MPSSQANRLLLTDKAVKSLPYASAKPKIIRDTKIAGFHLWVGKTTKTFRLQYETPRVNGQRGTTNVQWLGEHPHHTADEARAKALHIQALRARGEPILPAEPIQAPATALTFKAAWESYRAAITKEGKSLRTIADYQDKFNRHLKAWHDRPLGSIKREDVVQEHAAITERARQLRAGQKYSSGKYAANAPCGLRGRFGTTPRMNWRRRAYPSAIRSGPESSSIRNEREKPAWGLRTYAPGGRNCKPCPVPFAGSCTFLCSCRDCAETTS